MSLGDARDLSTLRPELRYARDAVALDARPQEASLADENLVRALQLARRVEELLEDARSRSGTARVDDQGSAHSTRMARAMAASLVDELEVLVRPRAGRASPRDAAGT